MAGVKQTPKVKGLSRRSLVLVACAAVLCSGCAISSRDKSVYYGLDYPTPIADVERRVPIPETLMIYKFLVSPEVDVDSITIKSQTGKERTSGERWQENPADTITELIIRDFQESNIFASTVGQLSDVKYRYALEGTLATMKGIEKGGKLSALIELEVTLIDFEPRLGAKKRIMNRRYRMEAPCSDSKTASLVKSFNEGLRQFSEKLRTDVFTAVSNRADRSDRQQENCVPVSHDMAFREESSPKPG